MKKIMFKNTQAVIDGRQTMTRRIIKVPNRTIEGKEVCGFEVYKNHKGVPFDVWLTGPDDESLSQLLPTYKIGEVVAVAQSYSDIKKYNPDTYEDVMLSDGVICEASHPYSHLMRSEGWNNKRFVEAELMPHRIRITDIKVERLQDISDADCLKEGVWRREIMPFMTIEIKYQVPYTVVYKDNPRDAFAALIDKVSGKGTWESNPWVFAYSFELVKGGEE